MLIDSRSSPHRDPPAADTTRTPPQKLLESTDEFGDTPIIKACRRGHVDVASYLLDQGANADARNEDGYTALMLACYWEQLAVVDLLLRHGADAGATSNNGVLYSCWCTCHVAAAGCSLECVRFVCQVAPASTRRGPTRCRSSIPG